MSIARDAETRAKQLFFSLLTCEQADEMIANGYVMVEGGVTGTRYRINAGYSQNIDGYEQRSISARLCLCRDCRARAARGRNYCFHMRVDAPYWDHMAAQLLYIKYAEREFLNGAYIS